LIANYLAAFDFSTILFACARERLSRTTRLQPAPLAALALLSSLSCWVCPLWFSASASAGAARLSGSSLKQLRLASPFLFAWIRCRHPAERLPESSGHLQHTPIICALRLAERSATQALVWLRMGQRQQSLALSDRAVSGRRLPAWHEDNGHLVSRTTRHGARYPGRSTDTR